LTSRRNQPPRSCLERLLKRSDAQTIKRSNDQTLKPA
jgi:hypothetical protein